MNERRVLLIGGVSLVRGRVREAGIAMQEICDELEPLLKEIRFTEGAPFRTISLIIRFGNKTNLTPDYDPIDRKNEELPVAVEVELSSLRTASKEVVRSLFFSAVIDVLIDVAQKYGLPARAFMDMRS